MAEIELKIDEKARERIGNKWLALMEAKLDDKSINATESAILVRLLLHSGYTLDPTRIPKDLQQKLTENLDLNDEATREELGILPLKRKA